MQDAVTVKTLMSDWLEESVKTKDEWRYATMEYGGQCVMMAGMRWMPMSSANSWDTAIQVSTMSYNGFSLTNLANKMPFPSLISDSDTSDELWTRSWPSSAEQCFLYS